MTLLEFLPRASSLITAWVVRGIHSWQASYPQLSAVAWCCSLVQCPAHCKSWFRPTEDSKMHCYCSAHLQEKFERDLNVSFNNIVIGFIKEWSEKGESFSVHCQSCALRKHYLPLIVNILSATQQTLFFACPVLLLTFHRPPSYQFSYVFFCSHFKNFNW